MPGAERKNNLVCDVNLKVYVGGKKNIDCLLIVPFYVQSSFDRSLLKNAVLLREHY